MQNPGLAGSQFLARCGVLALIIAASFISYVLRTNVSVVGENMIDDLGLTEVHLGMIFSSFALGYALFQIPGGVMGDRMGSRLAVVIIAVAWALLAVFTADRAGYWNTCRLPASSDC
ncbi:MAG: MFS transporter [Woeseiaceae bacterium]|nr:MFS transporter [Woeseiaceae bacterium]